MILLVLSLLSFVLSLYFTNKMLAEDAGTVK